VSRDAELRAAVFAWLAAEVAATGNLLDRDRLRRSVIAGEPMGLLDTGRGIRNPRALDASISVMTSPDGPYDDIDNGSGLIRYAFRTGRADQGDNRKLVRAHELGVPIIYFQKLQANVYTVIYPVRVAGADDTSVLLDVSNSGGAIDELGTIDSAQRRYVTVETRRRLHQVMFRGQVLVAYSRRCAVCRLHEPTLLEASHILGDADGGDPTVTNGLSLCTIHHRAYDRNLLGISADAKVHIARRLLADTDGPMLLHGLQEMHGAPLTLPDRRLDQPDRESLGQRFLQFRDAS